jgi:hypothetical protein
MSRTIITFVKKVIEKLLTIYYILRQKDILRSLLHVGGNVERNVLVMTIEMVTHSTARAARFSTHTAR